MLSYSKQEKGAWEKQFMATGQFDKKGTNKNRVMNKASDPNK